jgi:hypothetical protein
MKRTGMSLVVLAVCLLGLGVTARPAAAQDPVLTQSLRGLPGVGVLVEAMDANAERDGLTKDLIQTAVELQLRLAGIRKLTGGEFIQSPAMPYLYVRVTAVKSQEGLYAYSIAVGLQQRVTLANGQGADARTWDTEVVGTSLAANLGTVRERVKDQVDQFINAWLSVNPKK